MSRLVVVVAIAAFLLAVGVAGHVSARRVAHHRSASADAHKWLKNVSPQAAMSTWALLVAGNADDYEYDYSLISDICAAFQVLVAKGVPKSQIVLMTMNDPKKVVNNTANPFPGQVFHETGDGAYNVYPGCEYDYFLTKLQSQTVTAVLRGDAKTAGGRVLASGPSDTVFFFYTGHGGPDSLYLNPEDLLEADLRANITYMHSNQQFGQFVSYLDCCYSGSMYSKYKTDMNLYATTCANTAQTCRWGQCGVTIKGKKISACINGEFSEHWVPDAEAATETSSFQSEFKVCKAAINASTVSQWGNLTMALQPLNSVFGPNPFVPPIARTRHVHAAAAAPLLVYSDADAATLDLLDKHVRMPRTALLDRLESARALLSAVSADEAASSSDARSRPQPVRLLSAVAKADAALVHAVGLWLTAAPSSPDRSAGRQRVRSELAGRVRVDRFFATLRAQLLDAAAADQRESATADSAHIESSRPTQTELAVTDCVRAARARYNQLCNAAHVYSVAHMNVFFDACAALSGDAVLANVEQACAALH